MGRLLTLALREDQLQRLLPLIAFSAGSLFAGALLHLLPEAVAARGASVGTCLPAVAGFALFFLMEQLLSWHHQHLPATDQRQPVTYLILFADGLHNFIGGLAIAASFMVGTDVGVVTWIAAAAHEVPQELGDFGIMIRGGWRKLPALTANFLSAATVLPGGLAAYYLIEAPDTSLLLSFAAGNFIYIAASDLIPEVKHEPGLVAGIQHVAAFLLGTIVILSARSGLADIRADRLRARHRLSEYLLRHGRRFTGTKKAWTQAHNAWLRAQTWAKAALEQAHPAYLRAVDGAVAQLRSVEQDLRALLDLEPGARVQCLQIRN